MITRLLKNNIKNTLFKGKVILIFGPRQVGKTTLLKEISKNHKNIQWFNADEVEVQSIFDKASLVNFKTFLKPNTLVVIDEAQNIKDIGIKLKIIVDNLPNIQLLVSGSSSFELANVLSEPLTGRKFEYQLHPISFEEMSEHHTFFEEHKLLKQRLIYGYYPDVIANMTNAKQILKQLTDSYLYKDILIWNRIKKSDKLVKLLQALAYQIGNQVSYNELGRTVGLDNETVENYIILLEQSFVIYRLPSFSRNLRNELKQSRKIYFYDNGIRNSLIGNYNNIELRNDVGYLWENFIITERMKFIHYHKIYCNRYFWRTHAQQEIDYIEERDGNLFAYEFKWNTHKKVKIPNSFLKAYPNAITKIITPENYHEFITQTNEK
ncbi:MAG: ATP-binding protein [Flavobacteriaceae bacterium]